MIDRLRPAHRGFTLTEVLIAVGVIGILAALALPAYQRYIARSKASELLLKYDAVRTNIGVQARSEAPADDCAQVAVKVNPANLQDEYATMSIGFEPVTGGYTPVLTVCAALATQGTRGVDVARESYTLLNRQGELSPGAVVGDAAVSFSARLAGQQPLCLKATAAPPATAGCAARTAAGPGGAASGGGGGAAVSVAAASAPPQPPAASAAATVAPARPPAVCTASTPAQIDRQVMTFGTGLTGYIMNNGDLNTGGDMRSFTAEVSIVGGAQAPSIPGHGPTIVSYATRSSTNEFLIWNPDSLTVTLKNRDIDTHVSVNDGQNHRVTVTWQSAGGVLILYDNGREVWRGAANAGDVIGGNGKLVLGQDQDTYGGGFGTNDAYQGKIITASLATTAVSGAQLAAGPVHTALDPAQGLVTSVVLDANGRPVDSTGRATYTAGGSLTATRQPVDTSLYVTRNCQ